MRDAEAGNYVAALRNFEQGLRLVPDDSILLELRAQVVALTTFRT